MPEVWDPETFELPARWEVMSDTDLYELCETEVVAAEFTKKYLAVLTKDTRLYLFDQASLRLIKTYDESLSAFTR